jgi:hypothetical protein
MKKTKKKSRKGEKHEKPISLYPMTFGQALNKLLAAKPGKPKKKPNRTVLLRAKPSLKGKQHGHSKGTC